MPKYQEISKFYNFLECLIKRNHSKRRRKKKLMKKQGNKGITLIALVITIVVLLILAGVTIAVLTGDNRNLKKSE